MEDKGLGKKTIETFDTRRLFRRMGTRQWYPHHAFGARGSANHFGALPQGLEIKISKEPFSFKLRP